MLAVVEGRGGHLRKLSSENAAKLARDPFTLQGCKGLCEELGQPQAPVLLGKHSTQEEEAMVYVCLKNFSGVFSPVQT